MMKIAQQPIEKLPANSLRAAKLSHVTGGPQGPGFPDLGVCQIANDHTMRLMSWGLNITIGDVRKFSGLRFVWTGRVFDGTTSRDNFERLL